MHGTNADPGPRRCERGDAHRFPTLFVAWDLPPAPNAGARRLEQLIAQASEVLGASLRVVAPRGSVPPSGVAFQPFLMRLPSAKQNHVTRLALEFVVALELLARVTLGGYDRVVISSPLFIPTLLTTNWLRILRIPYILDVRDPYPTAYVEAGLISRGGLVHRMLDALTKGMYQGAELVTSATKGLSKEIRPLAGDTPVRTMRNGHGGAELPSEVLDYRWQDAAFTIGCHGNFGAFQDLEILVELITRVLKADDSLRFIIIGRGKGRNVLAGHAESGVWRGRVRVDPPVRPDLILSALGSVDLGLSIRGEDWISRNAFPVRITDYLELGVPVLVSPDSEAGRLVQRLRLGRSFDNDQVDEMVEYVLTMAARGAAYEEARSRVVKWRPFFARANTMRRFRHYLSQVVASNVIG